MINDSLTQLLTDNFINKYLLSSKLLEERIETIVKKFQTSMPSFFQNTLSLIREISQVNQLISAANTNCLFSIPDTSGTGMQVKIVPLMVYQGCKCALSSKCVEPSSNGIMIVCYLIEALLQSTLHCLYNQKCIDPLNNSKALEFIPNSRFSIKFNISNAC